MVSKAVSRGLILLVFLTLQAKVFCQDVPAATTTPTTTPTTTATTTPTTTATTTTATPPITQAEIAILVLTALILFFMLFIPCVFYILNRYRA